jgi:ATP-dependent helicase/DNAse subunit B
VGDPSVWASRREALLTRLDALVRAEAADADEMAPLLLEHQFGGRSSVPPLELRADGETIRVQGRIDRVDAGPARFRVIDYKNSGDDKRYRDLLKAEAFGVTSFQMPLYLLAAARALPQRVASATYLLLKSAERVEASAEALGLDEPALAGAVVAAVRGVRSGLLPISSRDCGGCSFGAVCRFQGVADADREQDGEGAP